MTYSTTFPSEDEKHRPIDSSGNAPVLENEKDILSKEKNDGVRVDVLSPNDLEAMADLGEHGQVTEADLMNAEARVHTMTLERTIRIMRQVREMHQHDQNFPSALLERMDAFLDNPEVETNPERYAELIHEMKLEALLVTENSPYAEVRAVVDPVDEDVPSLTIRVWIVGIILSAAGAFINQLFSVRQPNVIVTSNVAQLIAWPCGQLCRMIFPDWRFRLFGTEHSFNPGPFNRKEHMLITVMATVAFNVPYAGYIVLAQAMPFYFNQSYARQFGYQLLNGLGSNFVGYGLAGLARRFIVWPSFCVWPASLTTLAINKAFHSDDSEPVKTPWGKLIRMSRLRWFTLMFVAMFIYWWFPGFIFTALSSFNWISWIAPNHMTLNNIVGFNNGLGVNPWPTFDFNIPSWNGWTPMVVPLFSVMNQFAGMIMSMFMIIGFYWTNTWNTSYLPINSNHIFDNEGKNYNVSKIINEKAEFVFDKYQEYSETYLTAGNLTVYFWFFACYTATMSYVALYHYHEIAHGFRGFKRQIKKMLKKEPAVESDDDLGQDIHFRLMSKYKEVPEWWYLAVLVVALVIGIVGVAVYPTNTTPAVVIFGIIMGIIFIVPVGLITAITGVQITMNVLAEFIGGSIVPGNALAMNYFKMYGYIATAQAVFFCNDLKLAHYTKIPPRNTFIAQMGATLVSTFVCTAVYNFQMGFRDVCTPDAAFHMSCPGENTFFTASVFWGTIGPKRIFGAGGRYTALLAGFPVGFALPFITFGLQKAFPRQKWLRSVHPVMICAGGILWSPYNLSYMWPMVFITWVSWGLIKRRWFGFWVRYNYVTAAAWSAGVAVAAIVIFFAVQIPEVEINWWGNAADTGCGAKACTRLPIPDKGYFGPEVGHLR